MDLASAARKSTHTISTDILDDLASRFIINIPDSDRNNFVRMCFQIELAHWFYLDFYCSGEENRKSSPCGIKQFASHIFNHIPFLSLHIENLDNILQEWKQYKMSVPTYGAILMTSDLKHVLLVQSYWAKSSWGFPKGKVNEKEDPLHCAIREVYEETGYDIASLAKPDEFIEGVLNYQYTRLYLIRDVPIETVFVPRTRKEIKCCEWFSIEHLPKHKMDPVSRNHLGINPNSFFMIMPFVKRLKKWIYEQEMGSNHHHHHHQHNHQQVSKKSNACDSKHMMAAGVINSNATPIQFNNNGDRNDVKSPGVVYSKNNAGHRRQRHKSMGDFDSSNVVAHDSTGDTRISSKQQQQQQQQQHLGGGSGGGGGGGGINGGTDLNGVAKSIGGKRKLFTIDQTPMNRSSSPYASNFQLQPVLAIHSNGNSKQLVLNSLAAAEAAAAAAEAAESGECNNGSNGGSRKKKSAKSQRHNIVDQNGDDGMHKEYQSEHQATLGQQQQQQQKKWLFNPPKLSQLLCKEPNIAKWSNVRLNKDSIMHESLKLSGRKH